MSSEIYLKKLHWTEPRTIWTVVVQLFYSMLLMLPMYYYFREILELIIVDLQWIVLVLPTVTALILFSAMVLLDEYYWNREKLYKNRDIVDMAPKSSMVVSMIFFATYYLIFGYWLNSSDGYLENGPQETIQKLGFELGISLAVTVGISIFMIYIQLYQKKDDK